MGSLMGQFSILQECPTLNLSTFAEMTYLGVSKLLKLCKEIPSFFQFHSNEKSENSMFLNEL